MQLLMVFLGGGLGASLRWGVSLLLPSPQATWAVNLLGSFLLAAIAARAWEISPELRLLLATGLCGGFTTYSTFNQDTLRLLTEGRPGLAALNVGLTVVLCFGAGVAGTWIARAL